MSWWIPVSVALVLLTAGFAWAYPHLKQGFLAARHASSFRALARELCVDIRPRGALFSDLGFMPTVASVFGPFGEVHHVMEPPGSGEPVYLLEYRFGHREGRFAYRRGVAIVAVRLPRALPLLTLRRPRGDAKSRTTSFRVGGQRLVVEALDGGYELWFREREHKRARDLVTGALLEALRESPTWDLRAVDRWLVLFDEKARLARPRDALRHYLDRALHLRSLLGDGAGRPRDP